MDPLVFEPYFRPQVWGGRRLEQFLGRPLPDERDFGEAWMLSAQSLHVSRVAEGPLQGSLLSDLWSSRAAQLDGQAHGPAAPFPLLIKFLDCRELLSIQVHPNDQIARELGAGELGKSEAWVVLDAEPAARIYAGLRQGTTCDDVRRQLDRGTLAESLHEFSPRKGDCLFLPAGVVHAVGGGVLLAEVQQSSDATFRLFDWNRLGADGKPRTLHRDEALRSIDWTAGPVTPAVGSPLEGLAPGNRGQRLVACPHFTLDRFTLTSPWDLPRAPCAAWSVRFSIWIVLEGRVELRRQESGYRRHFRRGETVLVPAASGACSWMPSEGSVTLLGVSVPCVTH
jgi:mannose-6-phosphate isomerase